MNRSEIEIIEEPEKEWHQIDMFLGIPILNNPETHARALFVGDVMKYMRETFAFDDWQEIREQNGYFNMTTGFKFKNLEDATLFKLRWL